MPAPAPLPALPREDLEHVLEHTEGVWRDLAGGRLFLTGGTGFFGRWIVESFCAARDLLGLDLEVVALSRDPERFARSAPGLASHPAVTLVRGDIRTFDLPEGRFDTVIHAATAASAQLNDESPLEMIATIVDGTRRALEFASAAGARRFLFTSSGAVYGVQPPSLSHVDEAYAGAPSTASPGSAYGEAKRMAELLCAIAGQESRLEVVIARCFAFVGPYLPLDAHFAIGNFMRDALQGGPIRVNGDGTPYRSYLYASDLAIWLWTLLARGRPLSAYNVGSERALSVLEVARIVAHEAGGLDVHVAKAPAPGVPADRYVPLTLRARAELGLEERVPVEDAVRRTLRWHAG